MKVAILGTGKMGGTLGMLLASSGIDIVYGSRDAIETKEKFSDYKNIYVTTYSDAIDKSDVIIIATPWAFTIDLLSEFKLKFDGKIVVDMTNPLSPDVSSLTVGGNDSSAERIKDVLPDAHIVKSFNAITADNLPEPICHNEKTQAFYCSDHEDARNTAKQLIEVLGYEPVDCGALTNARYLESMAMLWIQLAFWEDRGSDLRFKMINVAVAIPLTSMFAVACTEREQYVALKSVLRSFPASLAGK